MLPSAVVIASDCFGMVNATVALPPGAQRESARVRRERARERERQIEGERESDEKEVEREREREADRERGREMGETEGDRETERVSTCCDRRALKVDQSLDRDWVCLADRAAYS